MDDTTGKVKGCEMEVYFENLNGETLCFNHAVKAVIEDNEEITAHAPDNINSYDMGDSGYLGGVCIKCFPPTVFEDEEEDD